MHVLLVLENVSQTVYARWFILGIYIFMEVKGQQRTKSIERKLTYMSSVTGRLLVINSIISIDFQVRFNTLPAM